jgi:hypothetical protein
MRLQTADRNPTSAAACVHHLRATTPLSKVSVASILPSAPPFLKVFFCERILESSWRNRIGTAAERLKAFSTNRRLVFVAARMWLQSMAGTRYLFGAISLLVKTACPGVQPAAGGGARRHPGPRGLHQDLRRHALGHAAHWRGAELHRLQVAVAHWLIFTKQAYLFGW